MSSHQGTERWRQGQTFGVDWLERMMKDFFISYDQADRAWAEWIAWQLENSQPPYATILQAWDFRPGTNSVQNRAIAAQNATRTIAVFSDEYFASNDTQSEWNAAYNQDPKGDKGILVPVKVKECTIPKLIAPLEPINIVGKPEEDAAAALLDGVKTGRVTPAAAPPFPGSAAAAPAIAPAPVAAPKPAFPGIERYDLFMSYVDGEADSVEEIARDLQSENLRVWRDRWIVAGPVIQRSVDPVLQRSNCLAICLGEHTPLDWFTHQLQDALNRQAADESLNVVPVRFPKAPPFDEDEFGRLSWATRVNASRRLIAAVRGEPARQQNGALRRESESVRLGFQVIKDLEVGGFADPEDTREAKRKLLDIFVEKVMGRGKGNGK